MGDQEVTASRQQLDEGGAGARAQGVPGLGLVQGQLQVFQVPRELQQAEGGPGRQTVTPAPSAVTDPFHRGGS